MIERLYISISAVTNYKKGDKVIIRKPSDPNDFLWFDEFMDEFDGKEFTVSEVNEDKEFVHVEEDPGPVKWTFSFRWLTPATQNSDDGYRKTEDGFNTNDKNWDEWLI